MSKPRPKIEIISAQPMSAMGASSLSPSGPSGLPAPPRNPPTVIRPKPDAESRSAAVDNIPAISKDANANAVPVPTLPAKKGTTTSTSVDSIPCETTVINRKVPPPRPQAPPRAPARAKKLAKQQRDGSQSPARPPDESQMPDERIASPTTSNVIVVENDAVSAEVSTNHVQIDVSAHDSATSYNSIPLEPPPVPPHCESDDYDPDTYEYMEPIDSLYHPPPSSQGGGGVDNAGVATNWKPVSPTVGGPDGEGEGPIPMLKRNGVPPKPRRSFRIVEEASSSKGGAEEPSRYY